MLQLWQLTYLKKLFPPTTYSNIHVQIRALFFRAHENARVLPSSVCFAIRDTGTLEVEFVPVRRVLCQAEIFLTW